jgi:hypothetical protein
VSSQNVREFLHRIVRRGAPPRRVSVQAAATGRPAVKKAWKTALAR